MKIQHVQEKIPAVSSPAKAVAQKAASPAPHRQVAPAAQVEPNQAHGNIGKNINVMA